ncbi:MAG TPA: DUF5668 domain-containing protein, partial [Fibrobacteraceae bacterium]|nr:DUF5668 domain-containing protein [Fibrobacteraceae bacterium]
MIHRCIPHHHTENKILWGGLFILAGLLLLAFNFGFLPMEYKHIVFSWPSLLIAFGCSNLWGRHSFFGLLLLGTGLYLLAPRLGVNLPGLNHFLVPLLLVLIGIKVLSHNHTHLARVTLLKDGLLNENNVFSGTKRKLVN